VNIKLTMTYRLKSRYKTIDKKHLNGYGFFIIRRARVMILDAFSEELKDLKACIERKIQHSYLDKYIENAVIDDCKLFIIYSIINKASLSEEKKRKYIDRKSTRLNSSHVSI